MNQTRGQGDKETRGQWQFRILSHLPLASYLLPLTTRLSPLTSKTEYHPHPCRELGGVTLVESRVLLAQAE